MLKEFIKEFEKWTKIIISVSVAVIILFVTSFGISDVSKETVCKSKDFSNQLLCFFFNNTLISAIISGLSIFYIIKYYEEKYSKP